MNGDFGGGSDGLSPGGEAELRQLHACLDDFKRETRVAIAGVNQRLDEHVRSTRKQMGLAAKERQAMKAQLKSLKDSTSVANEMLLEVHQRVGAGSDKKELHPVSNRQMWVAMGAGITLGWTILKILDKVWPSMPQLGELLKQVFMIFMRAAGQ